MRKNEYRVEDYIHGGEFVVLTNRDVTENKERIMGLITDMVKHGIAALGINEGQILPELASYCDKENLPLLNCPKNFRLWIYRRYYVKGLFLRKTTRILRSRFLRRFLMHGISTKIRCSSRRQPLILICREVLRYRICV